MWMKGVLARVFQIAVPRKQATLLLPEGAEICSAAARIDWLKYQSRQPCSMGPLVARDGLRPSQAHQFPNVDCSNANYSDCLESFESCPGI